MSDPLPPNGTPAARPSPQDVALLSLPQTAKTEPLPGCDGTKPILSTPGSGVTSCEECKYAFVRLDPKLGDVCTACTRDTGERITAANVRGLDPPVACFEGKPLATSSPPPPAKDATTTKAPATGSGVYARCRATLDEVLDTCGGLPGAGDAAREGWWADPSNKCGYCETALEHALGDAANDECKGVRLDQRNRTFAYVLGLLKDVSLPLACTAPPSPSPSPPPSPPPRLRSTPPFGNAE